LIWASNRRYALAFLHDMLTKYAQHAYVLHFASSTIHPGTQTPLAFTLLKTYEYWPH
jgi:hypothetical protein